METTTRPRVVIRPAKPEDWGLILAWRNSPDSWPLSSQWRPVTANEHMVWWQTHAMDATQCRLWLIRVGDIFAGMIRFDREGEAAWVSIYLAEPVRRRGIGEQALRQAWRHRPVWARTALAEVRENNPGAQAFFEALGFRLMSRTDTLRRYVWRGDDAA